MITSRTPFRISFFGGGTDYPTWYREHGGSVLSTTIDKYCYISCRFLPPFLEHKHRIVYSQIELVNEIEKIQHPSVRTLIKHLGFNEGLEIQYSGDLPARSGMGSSSAFTVGLLNALRALRGQISSKSELASQAIYLEQKVIGEAVGSQDQVSVSYGGFNHISFHKDDTFEVAPVILPKERVKELEGSLMLFFSGISRTASEIAQKKIDNLSTRQHELTIMGQMVNEALGILSSKNQSIDGFGKLLHESWKLKKKITDGISNSTIDEIYNAGIDAGALGGKVLGAGGGGFVLFFVKPEDQARVKDRLKNLIHVSFGFDRSGSKIELYNP